MLEMSDEFVLDEGVLRCPYDLNSVPPKELRSWCRRLLDCSGDRFTVDLSGTKHIASHHLGILSEAWTQSLAADKELVIVIPPDLRRIFELSGFDKVFRLVEKPGP